jgi:DNA-binding LacI/PurR family transcriptional regulator
MEPRLTTVKQPAYEIGEEAIRMLVNRIEENPIAEKVKCFEPLLVSRDSIAPPARREG